MGDSWKALATPAVIRPREVEPYEEPMRPRGEQAVHPLVLPYPPSVNDVWRIFTPPRGGHARIIKTKVAREYREKLLEAVGELRPLDGPVEVVGRVYRPRRVGDLDNVLKVLLDALKGLAFHDDKQVVHIDLHRDDDKERPRVELRVLRVETDQGRLL